MVGKWTAEEEKRLCEEVRKLGGKVSKWYLVLVEKNVFPGRSASSINSQYNNLLRKMSPFVDAETLAKEKDRRDKLKEKQVERILNNERPPLKQVDPGGYKKWFHGNDKAGYKQYSSRRQTPQKNTSPPSNRENVRKRVELDEFVKDHLGDILETGHPNAKKMKLKSVESNALYRRIFWAKNSTFPVWPCVTIPPVFDFGDPAQDKIAAEAAESEDKVFVLWFGDHTYSLVKTKNLYNWTPEHCDKYLKQKETKLYDAYVEAELFRRGQGANQLLKEIIELLGATSNIPIPISSVPDYEFYKNTLKTPDSKSFKADVEAYLDQETKDLADVIYSWLKNLYHNRTLNKKNLLKNGIAEFVAKLCFVKNVKISDLALSLLNLWNTEYELLPNPNEISVSQNGDDDDSNTIADSGVETENETDVE